MIKLSKKILCVLSSIFLIFAPCYTSYASAGEAAGAIAEALGAAGYVPWKQLLAGVLTGLGISAEAQIGVLVDAASAQAEQSSLVNSKEFKDIEKAKNEALNAAIAAGLTKVVGGVTYGVTYVSDGVNYVSKELLEIVSKSFSKYGLFKHKTISQTDFIPGVYTVTREDFVSPYAALDAESSRYEMSFLTYQRLKHGLDYLLSLIPDDVIPIIISFEEYSFRIYLCNKLPSVPVYLSETSTSGVFKFDRDFKYGVLTVGISYSSDTGTFKYYQRKDNGSFPLSDITFNDSFFNRSQKISVSNSRIHISNYDWYRDIYSLYKFNPSSKLDWSVSANVPKVTSVDGATTVTLPNWKGKAETIPVGEVAAGQEAFPVSIPALDGLSDRIEDIAAALKGFTQVQAQTGAIPAGLEEVITNLKEVTEAIEDSNTKAVSTGILDLLKDKLEAILEGILAIPGALVDLKDTVLSLPASIAQSFSASIPASDVATSESVEDAKIPGLSEVFPFCIPFDLIAFVGVLKAEPEAPRFSLPFKYPTGFNEWGESSIDIDLSSFDSIALLVRKFELLIFCLALVLITRDHMIKG